MISKEEKLKIKSIVDVGGYFSEDGIMDIADEIVPEYGKAIRESNDSEINFWYHKWKKVYTITWNYVTYKEDAVSRISENPMKEFENNG